MQNDLLQMAAKAKQQKYSSRAYGERYLGMAVIGELSTLTPANIRLLNLKADFGVAATEKAKELPKETPQKTVPAEKKEASGEPLKRTRRRQGNWATSLLKASLSGTACPWNRLWQAI